MPKYSVSATVTGGKHIGIFEAESPEKAIEEAQASYKAHVSLCWQCASECEDPETDNFTAEET